MLQGNGYPLQSSCLENPMYRGACWAIDHGLSKSQTQLKKKKKKKQRKIKARDYDIKKNPLTKSTFLTSPYIYTSLLNQISVSPSDSSSVYLNSSWASVPLFSAGPATARSPEVTTWVFREELAADIAFSHAQGRKTLSANCCTLPH